MTWGIGMLSFGPVMKDIFGMFGVFHFLEEIFMRMFPWVLRMFAWFSILQEIFLRRFDWFDILQEIFMSIDKFRRGTISRMVTSTCSGWFCILRRLHRRCSIGSTS